MEFTQETITWIINGIFAFFIIMGFLFGAGRGLKKSSLRLVFVVSIAAVMYFIAPYVSAWLLGYDFSSMLNGLTVDIGGVAHPISTIDNLITTFINSSQALQDFVTANPTFETLVQQLPTIVTNLAVFLLGFWLLKILTWPIFAIMASGYNKRKEDGSKPKKHRFAGGFIGIVQGAVIALVTFMPIAGVSGILNVEGTDGSGTLLGSVLPPEIVEFLPVYENSFMGKIGNIGNMDDQVFDGLTTITVTNPETGESVTIRPRQEAATGMAIAGDVQQLINMVQGIQNGTITDIDWDLIEGLVDKVFELNTLELILEEYAPYLVNEAANNAEYGISDQIDALPVSEDVRDFLDEFLSSLDEATIAGFKTDAMALVNIGRALDEHGIIDLIFQVAREEITSDQMAEQALTIFGTDRGLSNDIMVALMSSNSIQTLMPEAINVALGYIEYAVNQGRAPENVVNITRINADTIDWNLEASFLTDIMYNILSFVNSIDPFNLGSNVDEMELIGSLELSQLGEVINIIRSTQLFGDIYSSIANAILTMPQVVEAAGAYVDFDALLNVLNTTDWANEFDTVEDFIDFYIAVEENGVITAEQASDVISRLDSDLLELVIDGAVRAVFIEGFGETIGEFVEGEFVFTPEFAWLDDLDLSAISANADFFGEVIEFVFKVANTNIEDVDYADIQALVDAVQGVNNSLPAVELAQFKGFFNNFLHYMLNQADANLTWTQSLDIDDLIDNVDTVAELFKLALAIEDGSVLDYTEQDIDSLVAEIAELDNMSPELIIVLQGFYDDFMASDSPLFVPIDIATIDWATESDILADGINLFLTYQNTGTFNATLANAMVTKFGSSYVAGEFLNALIEELVDEEQTPTWIIEADMTWVTGNAGLVVELAQYVLWDMENDSEVTTYPNISALQVEVNAINATTQALVDFKAYMQAFVDSLLPPQV